jgi:hypothetical protein
MGSPVSYDAGHNHMWRSIGNIGRGLNRTKQGTEGEQSPSGIAVPPMSYGPMTMREGKHDSGRHPRGTTRGGVIFSK